MPSRRAPLLVASLLVPLLAAGCAEDGGAGAAAEGEAGLTIDADRPAPMFGAVETGPAVGPDLDATTAQAPRLVPGEWWRLRFTSGFYDEEHVEFVRVVADASEEGYVFGMPHEGWVKEAISYHAPAFGDVAPDLSYDTHNERFQPLRFPLVAGDTWETTFATSPLVATVESATDHTAEVVFRAPAPDPSPADPVNEFLFGPPGGEAIRLTYDARVHEVVKMDSFIGTWEVVQHGYDFRGWVSVPDGEHTAIDYGVFGADQASPLPQRSIEVDGSFNRMTVMHVVSAITPGAYRVTSTAPDGQSFVTELVGPPGSRTTFFEVANPGGTWQQEDLTLGAGATYTMGIAYQQYDILVPNGDRRASHGHEVVR